MITGGFIRYGNICIATWGMTVQKMYYSIEPFFSNIQTKWPMDSYETKTDHIISSPPLEEFPFWASSWFLWRIK